MHFLICCYSRTGSEALCNVLRQSTVGRAQVAFFQGGNFNPEYFPDKSCSDFEHYFNQVITKIRQHKIIFSKLSYFQLQKLTAKQKIYLKSKDITDYEAINNMLPNLKYIWLLRKNKIRQAISRSTADLSNCWILHKNEKGMPKKSISFNYSHIKTRYKKAIRNDQGWEQYFKRNKISPLVISYEDLQKNFGKAVLDIYNFLEVALPKNILELTPDFKKQADLQNEAWYHKYLAIRNKSPFHYVIGQIFTFLYWISNIFQAKEPYSTTR